jgi:uncharacterized membrane protein YgcG
MSAERINPEPSASDIVASSPEVLKSPFRVPLSHEANIQPAGERKPRRNRRKRKKELNTAVAAQQPTPQAKNTPPESGRLSLNNGDNGELTLWQRPEATPQNEVSAKLGKKVVGIAEQAPTALTERQESTFQPPVVEHQGQQIPIAAEQTSDAAGTQSPETPVAQADVQETRTSQQAHEVETTHAQPVEMESAESIAAEPTATTDAAANETPLSMPASPESPQAPRLNPFEQSYEPQAPPQPPDIMSYRRRFWTEQPAAPTVANTAGSLPNLHDYEQYQRQAYEASPSEPAYTAGRTHYSEAPAAVPLTKRYESQTPPGYQRTTADVSRAAWTGLFAGWWFGHRGKRKAVEQAHKAGVKEGLATAKSKTPMLERHRPAESYNQSVSPRLEAEPIHQYHAQEGSRAVVQPLSVETRNPLHQPEHMRQATGGKKAEHLAAPIAAIAIFDRAINRPALERAEVPPSIKLAAAKAAESMIIKIPEAVRGARSERQLSRRELMRMSKDIKIDGIPLKEIYKAHRIDEAGLASVVDTYLKGGDVRQQLAQEVTVKEQRYERDPVFRDQRSDAGERERRATAGASSSVGSGGGNSRGGGGSSVAQTIGSTLGAVAASTENTARSAGRAIASSAKTAQRDIIDNSNSSDWASITAVVVLYSIILVLLLT